MEDVCDCLRKTETFGALADADLRAVAAIAIERRFRRDDIILHAGDEANGLYLIVSGSVRAMRTAPDGRRQVIHVESEGATIAEVPVLDGGPVPSTLVANEDSRLLYLPKREFFNLCRTHPDVTVAIMTVLARRLRHCADLISELSLRQAPQRLAQWLILRAQSTSDGAPEAARVELSMTNQDIAAEIGTVREVVSRALAHLRREGLIRVEGRIVHVVDVEALADFANFGVPPRDL